MNRIFNKIEGKSCSCSFGKKCSGCKRQKAIKPVVYIEEPRRLPTSLVISRCTTKQNQQQKTEENKAKQINKLQTEEKKKVEKLKKQEEKRNKKQEEKRNKKQRKSDEKNLKNEQQPKVAKKDLPSIRTWYKQRKALIRLEHDRRKERQDKENEDEALHLLKEQAKVRGKTRRKVKEREASAKPRARSKYASAKYAPNKTLTYRFVNFCNKLCCQCYCYFSIIFILGFLFIYFI